MEKGHGTRDMGHGEEGRWVRFVKKKCAGKGRKGVFEALEGILALRGGFVWLVVSCRLFVVRCRGLRGCCANCRRIDHRRSRMEDPGWGGFAWRLQNIALVAQGRSIS